MNEKTLHFNKNKTQTNINKVHFSRYERLLMCGLFIHLYIFLNTFVIFWRQGDAFPALFSKNLRGLTQRSGLPAAMFPIMHRGTGSGLLRRCSVQTLVLMRVLNPGQGHPSVGKMTRLIQNSVIEFSTPHARVNYRRLLCVSVLSLLCYCLV